MFAFFARLVDAAFFQHPRSVGETYLEHACNALRVSGALATGAVAALVHACVPGLFSDTASSIARRVVNFVEYRNAQACTFPKPTSLSSSSKAE
jgi:hypothetical protein